MIIEANAWKNLVNESHIYMMQFQSGSVKEVDVIFKTLKDWHQTGFGHNKDGTQTYIFKKEFSDTNAWMEWVKQIPFIVNEIDKEGRTERLKTKVILPDDGKRKCKLCNKPGHNKATCLKRNQTKENVKQELKLTSVQSQGRVDGKNKCKICGVYGHNARRHSI